MNKEISRYQRELKRHMRCNVITKRKLTIHFNTSLSAFMEDQPDPTYEQLVAAFGPPQEMASILMEELSEREKIRYRFTQKVKIIFLGILATLFILFSLYVFFEKEFAVVESYDVVYPIESTNLMDGENN